MPCFALPVNLFQSIFQYGCAFALNYVNICLLYFGSLFILLLRLRVAQNALQLLFFPLFLALFLDRLPKNFSERYKISYNGSA